MSTFRRMMMGGGKHIEYLDYLELGVGEKIVIPTPFLNPSVNWDMSMAGDKRQNSSTIVGLNYSGGANTQFLYAVSEGRPFLWDNIRSISQNIVVSLQDNITYSCWMARSSENYYQAATNTYWTAAIPKTYVCDAITITRHKSHINFKFYDMTIYSGIRGIDLQVEMTLKPARVDGVNGYYDIRNRKIYPIV